LAISCITYLSFDWPIDAENIQRIAKKDPFLKYAVEGWGRHMQGCHDAKAVLHAYKLVCNEIKLNLLANIWTNWQIEHERKWNLSGLHLCAVFDLEQLAKHILNNEQLANVQNWAGASPLHYATRYGHTKVLAVMLDTSKVDVDPRDSVHGQTPLLLAAKNGHDQVVKMLLDTGKVDVNSKDSQFGQTTLSCAAEEGHNQVVKLLLDSGKVDINLKDSLYNQTPFMLAAEKGNNEVVQLLLDTGKVDSDSKSCQYGQTPVSSV
jgi:ankyrin repeat protein